jgi:hypothetical protein
VVVVAAAGIPEMRHSKLADPAVLESSSCVIPMPLQQHFLAA